MKLLPRIICLKTSFFFEAQKDSINFFNQNFTYNFGERLHCIILEAKLYTELKNFLSRGHKLAGILKTSFYTKRSTDLS